MKDEELKLDEPLIPETILEEEILENSLSAEARSRFDFIYVRIERWKTFYYRLTRGSTSGSVFCLLCLSFGSGILALPYSFAKAGIVLGILLFILASFFVYWTLCLLTKVAFKENKLNYSLLIYKYFGKTQVIIYEIMNLIANFGGIIVYQQISKEIILIKFKIFLKYLYLVSNFLLSFFDYCGISFIHQYPKLTRFVQMFSFTFLTQIPITQVKNIAILHKLSLYGTLALLFTVFVSLIEFPFYFRDNFSFHKIKWFEFDWNVIKILCMYFFAYANHNAVLNVIHEVKEPSKKKGNRIVNYAFLIELVTYVIVIFSGYLSTFEKTKEIFIDRDGQSIFLVLGKQLYIVSLTCHIGLYYFISRPSIEMIVNKGVRFTERQ